MATVSHRINLDGVFYQSVEMPTTQLSVTGLQADTDYTMTIQGVDDEGNIGPQSTPVVIRTLAVADETDPVISSVIVTKTFNQATIAWITDEPADSRVNYGLTTDYGSTQASANLVTSHTITITGLAGSTEYQYEIVSRDAASNAGVTANASFTTDATPDTTAPVITNIASAPTGVSAVITWTTDEPATSVVDYGLTTGYGDTVSDATLVTSHSLTMVDLNPGNEYDFRVTSSDASGNSSVSTNQTVTTNPPTPATPVLNDATNVTADGFTITCSAVSGALTYEFQIDSGGGYETVQDAALTLFNARDDNVTGGIAAAQTFDYRVRAANVNADTPASAWSNPKQVTTQATGTGPDPEA